MSNPNPSPSTSTVPSPSNPAASAAPTGTPTVTTPVTAVAARGNRRQLPLHQRAQFVSFRTPIDTCAFPWAWLRHVMLRGKLDKLKIVFPGTIVVVQGKAMVNLQAAITIGTVTHVSQVALNEQESHSDAIWKVASIEFIDPDDDEGE